MGFYVGSPDKPKPFPAGYIYPAPLKTKKEKIERRKSLKGRFLWPTTPVFRFNNNGQPIKGRVGVYNDREHYFTVKWENGDETSHYRSDPDIYEYDVKALEAAEKRRDKALQQVAQ